MPDTEVLEPTVDKLLDAKVDGILIEDKDIKDKGTIKYNDGTILTYIRNAFDHTNESVKNVLKTNKYTYVSPYDIATKAGKTLDERSYVPGKLGDVLESEVAETTAAIMITYGPTVNVEYDDSREAIEILVDDEGNIHGDSDSFNELKNSGYYVLQKPEDVLTPEVIEEYKATIKVLTKTTVLETTVDDEGFIKVSYSDDTYVKFTKNGEIVEDTRSEDPVRPYENYTDALKDSIDKEIEKDTNKELVVAITSSVENADSTFTITFSDGSEVTVKDERIVKDNRNLDRRYQSVYTELIYKYTYMIDKATDYFHEEPELTEIEQRRLADSKIMNLPESLLEKYTTNRASKSARVGHSQLSVNSLGYIRTSTDRILDALSNQKYDTTK